MIKITLEFRREKSLDDVMLNGVTPDTPWTQVPDNLTIENLGMIKIEDILPDYSHFEIIINGKRWGF